MNDRAPKNSPFRFLDLPQELQDKIIEFHYSKRQITLTYKEDSASRRVRRLRRPVPVIATSGFSLDLLYTNKHIYVTARYILAKLLSICMSEVALDEEWKYSASWLMTEQVQPTQL